MRLITVTPYDLRRDLGRACNEVMGLLAPGDWCCFKDHDALFTTPRYWYSQLLEAIEENPEAGLLTAVTNRIGNTGQVARGAPRSHDIREHFAFGEKLRRQYGSAVRDVTRGNLIGGVVLCMSVDVWREIGGFRSGFLGVDNAAHQDVAKVGRRVLLMPGLYVYHWYRADGRQHEGAPKVEL